MVKRYDNWCQATHNHLMMENATGRWIKLDDYEALQAALREALKKWQKRCQLVDDGITDNVPIYEEQCRITALRKEFLDV